MRFKGSKDQRINRPPKAAAKGSSVAEGGGQRINRPPKAAAKGSAGAEGGKDQPAAEGGSQRIKSVLRRCFGFVTPYDVMAYHHKRNGNSLRFSQGLSEQFAFHELPVVLAHSFSVM